MTILTLIIRAWTGELGFGRYFNQYLALELGAGYFKTKATRHRVWNYRLPEESLDFNIVPATATLKLILPLGIFELYGLGGGGAYFFWTDKKVSTDNRYASSSAIITRLCGAALPAQAPALSLHPMFFSP